MSSRWTGFFVWALVAASSAFWGIKIFAATRPVPVGAQATQVAVAVAGPMDRLFGAAAVAASPVAALHPESERFQLMGVIAAPQSSDSQAGLAIVSVDSQPARAWPIGATLDGNTTLLAVSKRTADFGPSGGPSVFTLQLPEPSAPDTGSPAVATPQPIGPGMQGANARHVAQPTLAETQARNAIRQQQRTQQPFQSNPGKAGMLPQGAPAPDLGMPNGQMAPAQPADGSGVQPGTQ
jgi:general secretion pathway protein C